MLHNSAKLTIVICILFALFGCSLFKTASSPSDTKPKSQDILAEYKGGVITRDDVNYRISKIPMQSQGRFKTIEGQQQILDAIALEEVFYQKALQLKMHKSKNVLEKNEAVKRQFLVQEYYQKNIRDKVTLTEKEKQDYYAQNKKDFYVQPYITILYLQTEDEAKGKKALDELKRGVPWDTVSANYNVNTYAKGLNGKIKNIRLNGYIPGVGNDAELDEIIKNNPADTTRYIGPQLTATGWSIIQIVDKVPGRQRDYLEVEPEVDQRMRPIKENEIMETIVNRLKKQYKVVVDSTLLKMVDLRDMKKNDEILYKEAVTSTLPELKMNIKQILDKFNKMAPQEQLMYIKGGGANQLIKQEINKILMTEQALKDKSIVNSLKKNEDFLQQKRMILLQETYKKLVVDAVTVNDADINEYYQKHLDAYTTPAARKILTVWGKDEKDAEALRADYLKAHAKGDRKAINELIEKRSAKPERDTLDNQYKNGVVTGIGPDKDFSDLIWSTPIGQVSTVIKSAKGDYVFFEVLEEKAPIVKPLNEVEGRIRGLIKKEKEKQQMDKVTAELNAEFAMKKYPERITLKLSAQELFDMADAAARQRKYKDAIVYYDQIVQFYPNGKDDYKASFMKAFLVAEEMGDKDQGLILFKAFLQKYPEGELKESAQFMIDELEGKHTVLEEDTTQPVGNENEDDDD